MVFNHAVQVFEYAEVVGVNLTASQRSVRQNVIHRNGLISRSIPCFAKIGLACSRISAYGVRRANGQSISPEAKLQGA